MDEMKPGFQGYIAQKIDGLLEQIMVSPVGRIRKRQRCVASGHSGQIVLNMVNLTSFFIDLRGRLCGADQHAGHTAVYARLMVAGEPDESSSCAQPQEIIEVLSSGRHCCPDCSAIREAQQN